jgi:hypothetical protein
MSENDPDDMPEARMEGSGVESRRKLRKRRKLVLPNTPYEVGYGRPPAEHRFKPGQSGNPSGRPKGARNKPSITAERLETMFYRELERKVPIGQDGRQITMPIKQVVFRSIMNQAAKGNIRAGIWVASTSMQMERDEMQRKEAIAQEVFEYKCYWENELAYRRAHGIRGLPDPIPHPDHVKFDCYGNWWIDGPVSDWEIEREKKIEVLRSRWKENLAEANEAICLLENRLKDETYEKPPLREMLDRLISDRADLEGLLRNADLVFP